MSFGAAVASCMRNYVTFSGRAPRAEFWWFLLLTFVVQIVLSVLSGAAPPVMVIYVIAMLVLFLPSLAVYVRRLHDIDRSGWWVLIMLIMLIMLIPLINMIMVLVWYTRKGAQGDNRFGPDPLA